MFDVLAKETKEKLIASLAETRGESGYTEREKALLLTWASKVLIDAGLLRIALDGKAGVDIQKGEVVFVDKDVSNA